MLVPEQHSDLRPIKYLCFFLFVVVKARKCWATVSKIVSRTIKCFDTVLHYPKFDAQWRQNNIFPINQIVVDNILSSWFHCICWWPFFSHPCFWLALLSRSTKIRDIWYDLLVALIGNLPFLNLHLSFINHLWTQYFSLSSTTLMFS